MHSFEECIKNIKNIYVFGSIARGDYDATSDLDLVFIISDITSKDDMIELSELIDIINGIPVQITLIKESRLLTNDDLFLNQIRKDWVNIL